MIKHEVIGLYVTLNGKNRIDFLINHYKDFDGYVSKYKDYIKETIIEILNSYRNSSDELGVRVQSSGGNSDPVFREYLGRDSAEKCFSDRSLLDEMFSDPYEHELIELALYEWDRLQQEHNKLISTMKMVLEDKDQKLISSYFRREKNLYDLAEELCIEMESANKRVYLIRKKLVKSIEPWFDKYNLKASA